MVVNVFCGMPLNSKITADKRLWYFAPTPKFPSATSFVCKTLYEIMEEGLESARRRA